MIFTVAIGITCFLLGFGMAGLLSMTRPEFTLEEMEEIMYKHCNECINRRESYSENEVEKSMR